MIFSFLQIIAGIACVLYGADRLTEGAVSVARRFNVPQMVIGLTIVALGTSMPEFFVSITSAIQGVTDIAVANVIGSNIFNVLLIGGVSAAIMPMLIKKSTINRDVPVAVAVSLLLLACGLYGQITRWMGFCFIALLVLYIIYTLKTAKADDAAEVVGEPMSVGKSALLIVLGLALLIFGSNWFVNGASDVASAWGISDAVIGLTIVAGGTSLPELATSVVAARKGQSGIAMGNIIGSNIYNILLIIGATGIICPLTIQGITLLDFIMMAGSIALLWLFSFTKYKLERWEGFAMTIIFLIYISWLVINA